MGMYGPTPSAGGPQGSWQPPPAFNPSPTSYPPHASPSTAPSNPGQMGPGPVGIPYQYGQLPANANPNDPKSQHPIPGSYNRHAFNPKTQSFVPNTGAAPPIQGQAPPYPAMGSHHSSPQVGSPHLAYAGGYQPTVTAPSAHLPPQPYGGGYAMARQGSNNSMMAFHPSQHMQQPPPVPQGPPQPMPQHMQPGHSSQMPTNHAHPQNPAVPSQNFSHLPPHYGNPATLPQKPT